MVTGVEPMSVLSSPQRQHMGSAQGSQLGAGAVLHTGDLARWVSSLAVAGAEAAPVLPGNSILVNTVRPNLVLGSKAFSFIHTDSVVRLLSSSIPAIDCSLEQHICRSTH